MINLNFLELVKNNESIPIFIKEYDEEGIEEEGIFVQQLPNPEYKRFFVSFLPRDGFSKYDYELSQNVNLSKRYLLHHLKIVADKLNLGIRRNCNYSGSKSKSEKRLK